MNYTPQALFSRFIQNHFQPFLNPNDQIHFNDTTDSEELIEAIEEHLMLYYVFERKEDQDGHPFYHILKRRDLLIQ